MAQFQEDCEINVTDKLTVKIISLTGKIAVVRYDNKTYIVARDYVTGSRPGMNVNILPEAISTGTEHGIDWKLIYPDGITISPEELQSALYAQGIFTIEDMERNPNGVASVIGAITRKTSANLYKTVHDIIGGT
ncbi:MAG: hypothetical protein WC479_00575 [Candidatus Izemoplasmatales bacterium]